MTRWEYQITLKELPAPKPEELEQRFSCDHQGECALHDTVAEGAIGAMEKLFGQEGEEGWELVQFEYHQRQVLCVWKRARGSA